MTNNQQSDLAILTGLIFVPGWYTWGSGVTLFLAFVPLLFIEADLIKSKQKGRRYFWIPFITFLVFNLATLWWIKNVSYISMLIAVGFNALVMSIPFWLFSVTHRQLGALWGYTSFVVYWVAFEFIYLNAEISFTWLNLGNGFANDIKLIQWYEHTGVLGGTLWVLIINLLLFFTIRKYRMQRSFKSIGVHLLLIIIILSVPLIYSIYRYNHFSEKERPYEIVVIQPNIDPYLKFNGIPLKEQMDILMHLADSLTGPDTDYIVAPETFINNDFWLDSLNNYDSFSRIKKFIKEHPQVKLIVGATTYKHYKKGSEIPTIARKYNDSLFFNSYNTALQIDSTMQVQDYHKSKLVVGVEKMPYGEYLGFLNDMKLPLGGIFRSHGTQDHRESLESPHDNIKTGPIICFESIFGEFVTEYVDEADANLLFIITNDGWWGETPGYKQHNSFASLRAIETRRSIARSANTGISCFIDQKGDVLEKVGWWKRTAIQSTLNANDHSTFYVKNGDYIGRIAFYLSLIILVLTLLKAKRIL